VSSGRHAASSSLGVSVRVWESKLKNPAISNTLVLICCLMSLEVKLGHTSLPKERVYLHLSFLLGLLSLFPLTRQP
jgi:hypothetical protein